MLPAPAPAALWRTADFRRLWAGQAASQLGEHTSLVILPLLAVLTLGVGADQLGVLRAVGQAPHLLLALLAGVWVDRWRTRTVMVLTDLGRTLTLGVVAVAALLGGLGLPALLAAAVVVGTLSVFFDIAYHASLVRLVPRDRLLPGTSALEAGRSAAQTGGPALGGTLTSLLPPPAAAASGALLFAVSFASLVRIRHRETIPAPAGGPRPIRRQIHEGLRYVAGDPLLRTVCLASGAFQFFLAAAMTAYLLFLPRELGLPGTAIGAALAATGLGALAGSLLAARLPGRFGYGRVVVAAAAAGDGVLLLVPALHGPSPATVAALIAINLVFGGLGQLVSVTVTAIRQAVTPLGMQGRVTATISFAGMGLAPLGSLSGGLLVEQCGLRTALLITAAGMMLSPLLMALSPLARLGRTLPMAG